MNLIHLHRMYIPQALLFVSSLGCILMSIICLQAGYFVIFQNLFYIPIILACIFYIRKGFLFSCMVALIYFVLVFLHTKDFLVLSQAIVRVIIFISIAGIVTVLAALLKKTEEKLRNSGDFKDSIIRDARIWLMVLDRKGNISVWNHAAEEMSGYRSHEVIGKTEVWKKLFPDSEYRKQVRDLIYRHSANAGFFDDFETTIQTKTGKNRIISWNIKTLADDTGRETNIIAVGVDVTDMHMASDALADQTRFLQTLIDTLPVPVFYKNRDGFYTGCNAAFEEYFGKNRDDIIGRSVYDLWPKEMADVYYHADTAVFESPGNQRYEASVRYADGSVHDEVFYKAPVLDNKSRVSGLIGAFLDVTKQKKSENALKKSETLYRSLFENMLEGFAYCQMLFDDAGNPIDWIYLDVNDAFEKNTGLADVAGRRASEIFPGIREQSSELFDIYNSVVVSGNPHVFETFFIHLDIWLRISVFKPCDEHFVAVFENITDRKLAEKRLNNIISEQETILLNVPALISFKDTNNRYIRVNPAVAQVMGRPVSEIEGKTLTELYPDIDDLFLQTDSEVIQSKNPKLGIIQKITNYNGETLWVQTDTVPLIDEKGDVDGVLVVSTDITEAKRAKDAISHVNQKLNLLSSITRHDIGNELQILFGYMEMIQEEGVNPPVSTYLEKMILAVHHIQRQIAFTRDYQDIGVHSPIWQDVGGVISSVVRSVDVALIEIENTISGLEVYADPLMEKVFLNLIDNAKRYGEKITLIRFFADREDSMVRIICEDDGAGIPLEYKSKIFNRGYYKHTGFGLNLSREILDITKITIKETGVFGEGARFEILVPKGAFRFSSPSLDPDSE
ncbi:MAG: PAS domain S-box protein [Methanospirillaceae archaeon]|nr:PAS domain S-box protein [Methanospirillaceae archaeon]